MNNQKKNDDYNNNNQTYDHALQYINIHQSKLLYQYKRKKTTYRFFDNDYFNKKEGDFKVKFVV